MGEKDEFIIYGRGKNHLIVKQNNWDQANKMTIACFLVSAPLKILSSASVDQLSSSAHMEECLSVALTFA